MRGLGAGAVLLGLASPAARAFDLIGTGPLGGGSVAVSEDFKLRYYHVDEKLPGFEDRNIHDFFESVNRLNALVVKGGFSIGAQLDGVALFSNRYILDDQLYHSWDILAPGVNSPWDDAYVILEKLTVQQRFSNVELDAGDTYTSFGRGIALNIVKNTDLDLDTSIRGVKAVVHAGDTDVTVTTGLTNRQQVSQENRNLLIEPDTPSMVTGASVQTWGLGSFGVGAHGVLYRFARSTETDTGIQRYGQPLDAVVSGATLDLPGLAGMDVYLEGDLFGYQADELLPDDHRYGYASYGSVSAYPGRTVMLVEVKRSLDTERINTFITSQSWEVATIPTLEYERVITEDASAAVNSNDLTGGRIRLDYAAKPGVLMPYLSVAAFRDGDTAGLHFNRSPESIVHPVTGLQWFGTSHNVQLNAGYRQDIRDESGEGSDRLAHLDGDVQVTVAPGEGIELALAARRFWWGVNPQQQEDFLEMENALSWHHGEDWVFIVYQDWSDNPLIRSEGNLSKNLYGALEVQWKPGPATVLKAFAGAYKAGIRCSGGQCRSLPGFEGARVSFNTAF